MSEPVTLQRELYVPRELVYDVWTQPEHVAGWYVPDGCRVAGAVVEPKVGGRFEVAWTDEAGVRVRETGRFLELDPPAGFACSIRREGAAASGEMRLLVRFSDGVDESRIDLEQDGVSEEDRDATHAAWEARLDRLEAYFSAI